MAVAPPLAGRCRRQRYDLLDDYEWFLVLVAVAFVLRLVAFVLRLVRLLGLVAVPATVTVAAAAGI